MKNKLSKKERGELVTKGFLVSHLKDQDYVTKSYLEDYLDKRFVKFRKEINEDFQRNIGALTEHYIDQLQIMFEGLDNRYVLRSEWQATK